MNDIILAFTSGNSVSFQYSLFHNDSFIVKEIENLTWASGNVAATTSPFMDGDTIQNVVGQPRDIVITIKPLQDKGNFDEVIHTLFRMYNRTVTLIWKNKSVPSFSGGTALEGDWLIRGVMTEIESGRFESDVEMSITIHCSYPYWTTANGVLEYPQDVAYISGSAEKEFDIFTDVPAPVSIIFPNYDSGYIYECKVNYGYSSINEQAQTLRITSSDVHLTGRLEMDFKHSRIKATLVNDGVSTDVTSKINWVFDVTEIDISKSQKLQLAIPKVFPSDVATKGKLIGNTYQIIDGRFYRNTDVYLTYYPAFI